jgi:hypothetical protein
MESADDALGTGPQNTDILSYMLANASTWFGFQSSGLPLAGQEADVKIWMDWPGFKNGTTNVPAVLTSDIPQTTTGTNDTYGNPIEAYKFKTVQVPANSTRGNVYYIVIAPTTQLGGNVYSSVEINYNNQPTNLLSTSTDTNVILLNITYTGSNWAKKTYKIFTNNFGRGYNVGVTKEYDPTNNYFRGGNLG